MLAPFGFDQYLLPMFTRQLPDYQWFFFLVTQIGSATLLAVLASLCFLFGKSNRLKVFSIVLIIGLVFSVIVIEDLKDLAQRPRPASALTSSGLVAKGSFAFPSGHAFTIFLAATILGAYFGWRFYISGYLLAFAVGMSRLYLGVHYPSDVIAGAILGMIMGTLVVYGAYRFGLCDNKGLLSLMRPQKPATLPEIKPWNVLVYAAILILIVLYFLDYAALSVITLTAASLAIILYVRLSGMKYDRDMFIALIFLAICLISALSLLYLNAYIPSLAMIAIAYAAILAIRNRGEKVNKT